MKTIKTLIIDCMKAKVDFFTIFSEFEWKELNEWRDNYHFDPRMKYFNDFSTHHPWKA